MGRERSMQWSLPSVSFTSVHVGTTLNKKLTEPPVTVKGRGIQAHVFPQRVKFLSLCK